MAVLVVVFGLPLVVHSATYLHILILVYFYAYLTTSWNLVGGFAGVLPLGHAAFIGIGAYTSTICSLQYGISPWIGMIIGGILATIVGVMIGLPTLKMRGAYFALATIAFAEGLRVMVENIDNLGPLSLTAPGDFRSRRSRSVWPTCCLPARSPITTSSCSCSRRCWH